MSQSSNSSWKSSESRKRARTSSPESSRKSQRKRSTLTLKRRYLEISSQSSSESFTRCDTQSTASFSITTSAPSETNSSNSEYASLATRYGISITSAKKYHSILTSTAQVPVIRTELIKQEPMSHEIILQTSPVFGSKKRDRKTKLKVEPPSDEKNDSPRGRILSNRANRKILDYFDTLDDTSVKQEPKSDNSLEEFEVQEIPPTSDQSLKNKHLMQNGNQSRFRSKSYSQVSHQRHQQTLSQPSSSNQHFSRSQSDLPQSQGLLQSNNQSSLQSRRTLPKRSNQTLIRSNSTISRKLSPNGWKDLIDSSGDEFVPSRSKKSTSTKSTAHSAIEKNRTLVTNPFSKVQKKSKDPQNSKIKTKSFWKKKFGSNNDAVTRKRKFLQTFMIDKKDMSDEDLIDCTSKVKVEKEYSGKKEKTNRLTKNNKKIKKNTASKKNQITAEKDFNAIELSIQSSVDSLSVNCQYFNPKTVEIATSITSKSCSNSPPLSFGADPSDYEQNTPINENIYDSNVNLSQDNVNDGVENHDRSNNGNSLEEEENNLNDSFLSLDLTESPTKSEHEESNIESLKKKKSVIKKTNIIKTVKKSQTKPKIISDSKLPNNAVILSDPKNAGKRELQLKVNSAVISEESNQQELLSVKLPFEKSININENTNGASPSSEPVFNGVTKTLASDHGKNQQQINSSANNNATEESFDSICQDITELTNNNEQSERITLYKGNDEDNINVEILSTLTANSLDIQQCKSPKCEQVNNDMREKSSPSLNISTAKKSPNTFQRNSRLPLNLKSPIVTETQENAYSKDTQEETSHSPKTSTTRPHKLSLSLKSPRLIRTHKNTGSKDANEKSSSSPSSSTSRKSPITFQPNSQLSLSLKSPSTTKTQENIISTKPNNKLQQQSLSQSVISETKQQQQITSEFTTPFQTSSTFANKDPRLNRSISPVKSISPTSRDPRLNRSTSPSKSPVVTDSRLVRSSSRPISPTTCADSTNNSPDPRLRKRKEREDTEKILQPKREIHFDEQEIQSLTIIRNSHIASHPTLKKASIFERLGKKSPSPNKPADVTKELIDIVKNHAGKRRSIGYYDSDDEECISIHPGHMFSSDEESNASPPHRKFTSERMRVNEEIRNMQISVKDRLSWNTSNKNQRKPTSFITPAMSTMAATTTTSTKTRVINRITFNTNTNNQSQPVTASTSVTQPLIQQMPKMSGMAAYASQCRKIPFNTYGNNDPAFNEQFYKSNSESLNDKYYKMNAAQMLKDVDNLSQFGSTPNVTFGNNNGQQISNPDFNPSTETPKIFFFRSYCFRILRSGNCPMEMTSCHFSHHVYSLQKLIAVKKIELLQPILEYAIQHKFAFFLQNVWNSLLPILNHEAFNFYNKLYQAEMRSECFLNELLDYCLNTKLHTVESFVKKLAPYIEIGNRDWVRAICVAIKAKMSDGFCWETIKCLSQKAVPPVDMIELTILQCLKRKKNSSHINEVYDLVKHKMNNLERNRMSQSMLKQFFTVVQKVCLVNDKEVLNTIPIANPSNNITENTISSPSVSRCQSVESVRSAEIENHSLTVKMSPAITKNRISSPLSPIKSCDIQQPNDSPVEVQIRTPNKGESTSFSEYIVTEVQSSESTSAFRNRFWKLYLAVTNVDQGLNHEDYDYVWKTLDEFSKQNIQDSLLKRAYYHILCKRVKSCEQHISEIIKRAVHNRWPTSQKCLDLLFEVGICALIDLTDSELWVMALNLLNSMKIIEPNEPRTAFVLICAEIYLANNDPLEALYLLQRTRLIKTNRDEWLTKDHTINDEKHRNKVVIILLEALSYTDPEKAVYVFKALLVDQYIYYYPIDLRLYLDKLILLLLLHEEEELIADVCREIIAHDLTLQRATYRELITRMLPTDEVLTNQVLDYAIHLGYYNDIQIKNGFTTVIVDTNLSEEELYLILRRLIHILVLNVGPVIHRLKPNQLKVTLIFEDIPMEKRLYRNETAATSRDTYKGIRNKVNKMLATRFTPPIRISRGKINKFCKIMSRTLVDYLKHWN